MERGAGNDSPGGAQAGEPLLRMERISKHFPGVQALQAVSLAVDPGECLGLVGENGAGKSTLMKILSGVYPPDEGELYLGGQPVVLHTPRQAHAGDAGGVEPRREEDAMPGHPLVPCERIRVTESSHVAHVEVAADARVREVEEEIRLPRRPPPGRVDARLLPPPQHVGEVRLRLISLSFLLQQDHPADAVGEQEVGRGEVLWEDDPPVVELAGGRGRG